MKKEISCNFNSTPNNSNDFAIKLLCDDASCVFSPGLLVPWGVPVVRATGVPVSPASPSLSASPWPFSAALAVLFAVSCEFPWFGGRRGSCQAGFGRALPFALGSGVILGGSSADPGGSCERGELPLARREFLREHPEGEKHHFCLLRWLQYLS